jgi:hypothetical protein
VDLKPWARDPLRAPAEETSDGHIGPSPRRRRPVGPRAGCRRGRRSGGSPPSACRRARTAGRGRSRGRWWPRTGRRVLDKLEAAKDALTHVIPDGARRRAGPRSRLRAPRPRSRSLCPPSSSNRWFRRRNSPPDPGCAPRRARAFHRFPRRRARPPLGHRSPERCPSRVPSSCAASAGARTGHEPLAGRSRRAGPGQVEPPRQPPRASVASPDPPQQSCARRRSARLGAAGARSIGV